MRADTYGALIVGALVSSVLSGIVTVQSLIYYKLFPSDCKLSKCLVLLVWTIDLTHTALVWEALWQYFIVHFGEPSYIDVIPGSIALSVVLTATITFLAHCLFAQRIYFLSKKNMYITGLIITLAFGRLAAATISGVEMIYLHSYRVFRQRFLWLFTLGLSLSCTVDILITLSLFFLLAKNRKETVALHRLLDSLILYAFETGLLTSAATAASLLCWVILHDSLIFLGLHFAIGQLYANSLLATLNSRDGLRRAHSSCFDSFNITLDQNGTSDLQLYYTPSQRRRDDVDHNPVHISPESLGPISFKENEAL